MPRTNFSPQQHGFHFVNNFINRVATIPGFGQITTRGRCGGMAFAALDYYFAGMPIPRERTEDFPGTGVPPDGHPLADYIFWRLMSSFIEPTSVNFVSWTIHADHATWFFKGVTRWTKEDEFPRVRQAVDQGRPVPLGLIQARSLTEIGANHQVVAYGYEFDEGSGTIQVYVYDNNHRDIEVVLSTDPGNPHVNASSGEVWRGFFVESYTPWRPTYQSPKEKDKEKDKEKEKEKEKEEKEDKEDEKLELEKLGMEDEPWLTRPGSDLMERLNQIEKRLGELEGGKSGDRTFVRPEERPPVGEP